MGGMWVITAIRDLHIAHDMAEPMLTESPPFSAQALTLLLHFTALAKTDGSGRI
jgi:hypothetical protein